MATIGPATYNLLVKQVRLKVVDFVTAAFGGLGSWRDEDVERFVNAVVPVVLGGQRQIATLTHTFLAAQVSEIFGGSAAVPGIDLDETSGAQVRNGTEPRDVYRRPFVETYTALKEGFPLDAAVQRGVVRASQLAGTDIQLAKTHAARNTLRSSKARYFRRTLTGSENCGLCVIASTQRYRTDELMPIHPGCDCGVAPLKGNAPRVHDSRLLEAAHDLLGKHTGIEENRSGRSPDYRQLIVTHEHGEMGPLLSVRGQHFTGPSDIH